MIHENLLHLQRLIALGLAAKLNIPGKTALEMAATAVEVLQQEVGGDRLGSKGVYIPAPNHRQRRDERIREAMGPPPYSRSRVRDVAAKEGVSQRTVWRALKTEAEVQG